MEKLLIALMTLTVMGCATSKGVAYRAEDGQPVTMGPAEPAGPPLPPATPQYGPDPVQTKPLVLVLGPGMARGFAHAGVLRALKDARIPVGAIVGTEMGALIGALYAMNPSMNQFEWSLLKFKDEAFLGKTNFLAGFFKGKRETKVLDDALIASFGKKDLKEARVPLNVVLVQDPPGRAVLYEKGGAAAVVRAAISDDALIPARKMDNVHATSSARVRPFPISEARQLGIGPVVVIDTLASPVDAAPMENPELEAHEKRISEEMLAAEDGAKGDLKDADLVLTPDLRGIGYLDFQKRNDSAFRGKSAVQAQLQAIKQLVGTATP